MSTHIMDVSGQRALSLTINDPARSAVSCNAKQGDDVTMMLGGAREVRLVVPPGARIERREYITRSMVRENNQPVKDKDGEYVYEETPYEQFVLVSPASVTMFGRVSKIDPDEEGYEGTPHTTVNVRKQGADLHFTESGKLLGDHPVEELFADGSE